MNNIGNLTRAFRGEFAALLAAFFWASATVLFGRIGRTIRPLEMNLIKNVIAAVMILITLAAMGNIFTPVEMKALILLFFSGAVGIGLGDTVYFRSLKCIGARRALLLWMLSPPLTGVFAHLFMREALNFGAWMGIFITIIGVAWVISERVRESDEKDLHLLKGIMFGMVSAVAQATGAVLSRAAFVYTAVSPLQSSLWRLLGGILVILVYIPMVRPEIGQWVGEKRAARLWIMIVVAVFAGTYLGIWLQQISLKYAAAGIAQTLFATSPLFVIPIVLCMGEKISFRAVLGVVIALGGIGLLFGM